MISQAGHSQRLFPPLIHSFCSEAPRSGERKGAERLLHSWADKAVGGAWVGVRRVWGEKGGGHMANLIRP